MTPERLFALRQTQNWRYKHALTVTGYYVAGVDRHEYVYKNDHGQLVNFKYISGRVVMDHDDNRMDSAVIVRWRDDGRAIRHEFGDLNMETV